MKEPSAIEPYTSSVEIWMNFSIPRRRASSSRTKTPRTSVSMKDASPRSDRSTCVSAAKFTTWVHPSMAARAASGSAMSPLTKR